MITGAAAGAISMFSTSRRAFAVAALVTTCAAFTSCEQTPAKLVMKDAPAGTFSKKDDTVQLRAIAYDKDGIIMKLTQPLRWSSSQPDVASVDATGLVTVLRSGTTTVSATFGALSAAAPISAAIVGSVSLEPSADFKLKYNKSTQLVATVKNDRGEPMPQAQVRWSASTYAVDIQPDGTLKGQALGACDVKAESGGKAAYVHVTVAD